VLLAMLGLIAPCLLSAQVFKYKNVKPVKGVLIRTVPFERWLKGNGSGPACLAMVLNYWEGKRSFSQREIMDEIKDSENPATCNSEMVLYPRRKGFANYSFQGDLRILREVVSQGIPVIALTRAGTGNGIGHYRVVIGFDEQEDQVIFHDPDLGGRQAMRSGMFMRACESGQGRNQSRWMMAVVPSPERFPFPALKNDILTSSNLAMAYFRRSDFLKAREQREKAKESDPYSLYSLAMVSLKEGKAGEAEAFALKAISMDGNNAYAHDALGQAYARQGRTVKALHSLEQARRLAPGETLIRSHYLQVRAHDSERARLDIIKKGVVK
jgi:tetratricopeptide (TPR) repeat protein